MKRRALEKDSGSKKNWMEDRASSAALFFYVTDILEEIFLNLPPKDVVLVCRRVCYQWKEVADRQSLWRERCRRESYHIRDASKLPEDWRRFYFLSKNRRNLLKNSRGDEGMDHWEIQMNGGDQWVVHDLRKEHPDNTVKKNFVTSFGMCIKSQLIDLEREGYNSCFMDNFQPSIRISDWFIPTADYCGALYQMRVDLLNERRETVQMFAPDIIYFERDFREEWNQMTHVFKNYGPGVRFIRFTHGGKDLCYWKGWYGIHITDSCVELCATMDA